MSGPRSPNTAWIADVAARGTAAINERRQARQYGNVNARQGIGNSVVTGQAPRTQSSVFDEWAKRNAPRNYQVTFGQTEDGNYGGFRTEGELKAAIEGRAYGLRDQDLGRANDVYASAESALDQMLADYDRAGDDARTGVNTRRAVIDRQAKAAGHGLTSSNESGVGYSMAGTNGRGSSIPQTQMPARREWVLAGPNVHKGADDYYLDPEVALEMGLITSIPEGTPEGSVAMMISKPNEAAATLAADTKWSEEHGARDAREQFGDYNTELSEWLATQSEPQLEREEFAQQMQSAPFDLWTERAGAEYGVDPNLVAGWFDPAFANTDFRTQRDAEAIQSTGMPYAEYQDTLSDISREQDQAMNAQTAADEQALSDAIYSTVGVDGNELAQSVNLSPAQLAGVVLDNPDLEAAMADADTIMSSGADDETIAEQMNQVLAGLGGDPVYASIFRTVYGSF